MNLRRGFCALILTTTTLGLATTGCQSGGGSDMVTQAMNSIPSSLKSSVNGYMSKYGDMNKLLGSITDSGKAQDNLPKLDNLIGSMDNDARAINNASPDVKSNIKTAFGPQLGDLTKGLDKNVSRLLGNNQLSSMLKPSLDRIPKLFL